MNIELFDGTKPMSHEEYWRLQAEGARIRNERLVAALEGVVRIYDDKGIGDCVFSAEECCEMMADSARKAL